MRKKLSLCLGNDSFAHSRFRRRAQQAQNRRKSRSIFISWIPRAGRPRCLFLPPDNRCWWIRDFRAIRARRPRKRMPGITRDADRIMAVLKLANVNVLDYLVITHYHADHAGNAAELANRIPIRHFIDHGPYTVEMQPGRDAPICPTSRFASTRMRLRRNPATRFRSQASMCRCFLGGRSDHRTDGWCAGSGSAKSAVPRREIKGTGRDAGKF